MDELVKKYLEDILIAVDEIDIFFETKPKRYDAFVDSLLLRRGIERNIEIIGEAMNRILKTDPKFPIETSRRIVDTRNRIIHGYDSVSEDVIWLIIVNHLPNLEKQVKELLKEEKV